MASRWRFILALGAAAALILAGSGREPRPPRPGGGALLTVISVDGLSWDRVTPLHRRGVLPVLDALLDREGAAGDIVAKDFPTRTAILASLATGRWPQHHGIAETADLEEGAGRARKPIWRYLAEEGQPCAVAAFPLAFPREHSANRVVPPAPPAASVPPALAAGVTGGAALPAALAEVLRGCLAADLGALAAAREALAGGERRHLFLHLPGLGRWEEALREALPAAEWEALAAGYYRALDGMLGEALSLRGGGSTVLLISEQGNFDGRPSQRRDFPIVERYPAFGFLWAAGPGIRDGILPVTLQPPDLLPTLLYLAGVPLPNQTDGRVAFGLLEEDYYYGHPLLYR